MWHVHGSYTTSLVQGDHLWYLPVTDDRGPDGRGRAETWDWPANAREVTRGECADLDVDVVVLQRPEELVGPDGGPGLAEVWLGGRRPGRDVPAVYLEHNAPQGRINELRHPVADRPELRVVHVTPLNALFWDTGTTPTTVVEHGVVDPGYRYTGELGRTAVAINDPVRRARVTGTDLLPHLATAGPIDLFGMRVDRLDPAALARPTGSVPDITTHEDLPQARMHAELALRRVYVHTARWTSLGLSLLEAMHLGMPVVAVGSTEAFEAVPPEAGVVSTDIRVLVDATRRLLDDPDHAEQAGRAAREAALRRYGLGRFLQAWDAVLEEVAG